MFRYLGNLNAIIVVMGKRVISAFVGGKALVSFNPGGRGFEYQLRHDIISSIKSFNHIVS